MSYLLSHADRLIDVAEHDVQVAKGYAAASGSAAPPNKDGQFNPAFRYGRGPNGWTCMKTPSWVWSGVSASHPETGLGQQGSLALPPLLLMVQVLDEHGK